jgi:hypothetical protein
VSRRDRRRLLLVLILPLPLLLLPLAAGFQWFYSLGVLGRVMATPFVATGLWLSPRRPMVNTSLGAIFWYIMGMVVVGALTSRRDALLRALAVLAIIAAIAVACLGIARPQWTMN